MNKLLCRLFVKNYQDTSNPDVRQTYGKLAGIVGIVSNMLLCIAKVLVGIISGSIAIVADGINNLADASSSIITLVGFKLASMPEDEEHPYGHARYEYITGMIVSVLIVVVGVELAKASIGKIITPEPVAFSYIIVIVLLLSIAVKLWQSGFYIFAGKSINSLTLTATAADSRNDVISTTVVLVSLIAGHFLNVQIDGYMGLAVAAFIFYSGIGLIKETASPLLGESPDPQLVSDIAKLALSYDGVLGIHDLAVHNYGPGKVFVSIHIEVDADGDLMASHDLIDNIERDISKKLKLVMTAHMDPIKIKDPLVSKFKEEAMKIASGIEGVSNVHDLRIVKGQTHTNIIFDVVVSPDCKLSQKEIAQKFQAEADKLDGNYFVVINFDSQYATISL